MVKKWSYILSGTLLVIALIYSYLWFKEYKVENVMGAICSFLLSLCFWLGGTLAALREENAELRARVFFNKSMTQPIDSIH